MTLLEELNYLEQKKKQFWLKLKTFLCLSYVLYTNLDYVIGFDWSFLDFFLLKKEPFENYLTFQDYKYLLFGYAGIYY